MKFDVSFLQNYSRVLNALRGHLLNSGLIEVPGPTITSNDCEGGGESFPIMIEDSFFNSRPYLTVSRQLHLEAICGFTAGVFSIGPVFRAEKHDSRRHLAEFIMAEVELPFMSSLNDLIYHCFKTLKESLLSNSANIDVKLQENVSRMTDEIKMISYTDAVNYLTNRSSSIKWGIPLNISHEISLCEYVGNRALAITDYPKQAKPFYMKAKPSNSGMIVECFDIILPGIGEVAGGSLRESDCDALTNSIKEKNLDIEKLKWYVDLRRSGHPPTGGYGIGTERILTVSTGAKNIRDTIPFPRVKGTLHF